MSDVFQDPKVGDPIAYYPRGRQDRNPPVRLQVVRVTSTQVVANDAYRFKRRDGVLIGRSRYDASWAVPWTPEVDARIAAQQAEAANLAAVDALYKRLSTAVESAKFSPRGFQRKWAGDGLAYLEDFVADIERRVAGLLGAVGSTP